MDEPMTFFATGHSHYRDVHIAAIKQSTTLRESPKLCGYFFADGWALRLQTSRSSP